MKKITTLVFISLVANLLTAQSVVGDWYGKLSFSGVNLRLVLHIQDGDDGLTATMDSPDQGANGIPVETVKFDNGELTLILPRIGAQYTGTLSADGRKLTGTFQQGGANIPLEMEIKEEAPPGPNRPQEPKPPFPYRQEQVKYDNPKAEGVTLAGTLTLPEGEGPFPAVILISGSGPQDRNEELLGHKPFLVISDHFTRNGIAVLRYDDRGVKESTGNFQAATSADFATDVEAGFDFLKNHAAIDADHIGLVGHSEGGLIAPMVAAENPEVAFIVLMAGPGVKGEDILLLQQSLLMKANGGSEEAIKAVQKFSRKAFKELRKTDDSEKLKAKLTKYTEKLSAKLSEEDRAQLGGDIQTMVAQQVNMLNSPWFRYFLTYDPAVALARVQCPVLAINGDKDLQVDAQQNIPAITKALEKGGNDKYRTVVLPKLNHLFQHSETGSSMEYATIEETFALEALELMTDWIMQQVE